MRLPGRFEWKILGAMLIVAGLSVGTAAFAIRYSLRGMAAYSVEYQRQIGAASQHAAAVFEGYFAGRKELFRRRAERIAAARPARLADLAETDDLARARLLDGTRVTDSWEAPPEVRAAVREAPPLLVGVGGGMALELTFGIPLPMYESFLALRGAIDDEQQRERVYEAVAPAVLREYLLLVLVIIAGAPVLGFVVARRATQRVARLHQAALRVGAGDLGVRVAPRGRDELDELGRAFDRMVSELAEARSRLEYLQKVSAWQEVARRLAHEIKNPLTPVQLSIQQLHSQYRGDDPAYRRLLDTATEIMREEIGGLRRLVDDFSAFAKLPKVDPAPLDVGGFVHEFARLHPEWEGVLRVTAVDAVTAACDKLLLRRALANLVENAIQAAAGLGRAPQVELAVQARPAPPRAAIVIDDNGPGVPVGDRWRVFDPYVTSKEGGTGLGLAIVRKILIDHGGDVSLDQAPPPLGGARFVLEIPATLSSGEVV